MAERDLNYKLSATRMVVEHAFGLLKNRWRILSHIQGDVPKAVRLISSCIYLHNFTISCEPQNQVSAIINHTSDDEGENSIYEDDFNYSEANMGVQNRRELINMIG